MTTIPNYPRKSGPLDGAELIAGWSNGQQVAIPTAALSDVLASTALATAAAAAATSQVEAESAASQAIGASIAAGSFGHVFASILPQGVTSVAVGGAAIAGATPGSYPLTAGGGDIAGVSATLVVDSPAAARVVVNNPGLGSGTTPPTFDLPAGATLPAGTTIVATVGSIIADQKTYWAASADGSELLLYGNNGGALEAAPFGETQLTIPAGNALPNLISSLSVPNSVAIGCQGVPADGGANVSAGNCYIFDQAVPVSGPLNALNFYATGDCTLKVKRFTKAGNVFTEAANVTVAATGTGLKQLVGGIDYPTFNVNAGDYLGFYLADPTVSYKPGAPSATQTTFYVASGDAPGFTEPGTDNPGIQLQVQFGISHDSQNLTGQAFATATTKIGALGRPGAAGKPTLPLGGQDVTANFYVIDTPLPGQGGRVDAVRLRGGSAGGNLDIYLCDPIGDQYVPQSAPVASVVVQADQDNTLTVHFDYAPNQRVGFWTTVTGVYTYNAGPGQAYYSASSPAAVTVGAPTTDVQLEVGLSLRSSGNPPLLIVVDGDSLPAGATPNGGEVPVRWSDQLAALMPRATIMNVAVSGQDVDAMQTRAPTYVYPHAMAPGYRTVLIVDGEPYNQMRTGTSIADALAKLESYFRGARDAGFDLIMMVDAAAHNTATNLQIEGSWDRTLSKDQLNAEMRQQWPNYNVDRLIDIGAATAFGDYTNGTYYQTVDEVHWKTAAHTLITERIFRELSPYY